MCDSIKWPWWRRWAFPLLFYVQCGDCVQASQAQHAELKHRVGLPEFSYLALLVTLFRWWMVSTRQQRQLLRRHNLGPTVTLCSPLFETGPHCFQVVDVITWGPQSLFALPCLALILTLSR